MPTEEGVTEPSAVLAGPYRRSAAVAFLALLATLLLVGGGQSTYASSGPVGPPPPSGGGGAPPAVPALDNVVATAGGGSHSLALLSDGTVFAWGENGSGQLGDGTNTSTNRPVQVCAPGETAPCAHFLNHVTAIAAGLSHSIALRSDGTVFTWGDNTFGQLGNGTTTNANTPVQVCATGATAPCTTFLDRVTAIAAGGTHSMALLFDGTVRTWGNNETGQLGNGTTTNSTTPVQVCATGATAPCTTFLDRVIAIAAGVGVHSMALIDDGTVRTWGSNIAGQLGNGTTTNSTTPVQVCATAGGKAAACSQFLTGVKAIAAGGTHSLALLNDGTVRAWGLNDAGQLGNGTTTNSSVPVQVCATGATAPCTQLLTQVKAIAGGASHSIALLSDSTVRTWGSGAFGQLGNGRMASLADGATPPVTSASSSVPVQVCATGATAPCTQFLTGVKAVAAGNQHSLAVLFDGTERTWGFNAFGQLGDGTNTNRSTPVQVIAPAQADPGSGGN